MGPTWFPTLLTILAIFILSLSRLVPGVSVEVAVSGGIGE